MKLAHLAGLACGLALLLGACSGNNASGTTTGGSGGTGDNGGSDGGGMDGDNGDGMDDGKSAEQVAAETAVMAALAVTSANADAFADARTALAAWVTAAEAAFKAAEEADPVNPVELGAASRILAAARAYQETQEDALSMHEGSFAWYGTQLARVALANGTAAMPGEGSNTIMKAVAPRTDSDDDPLDARLKSDTFKSLMYEEGKMVFSNSGDQFKVGGYVSEDRVGAGADTEAVTGLTLTSSGVVIRTGNFNKDYMDALKDITAARDAGAADKNQWDLTLTFDAPRPQVTVDAGDDPDRAASWTGNSDFYWKGIAMADESQLKDGANYQSDAFKQAAGFEDLGTYELWLSNHIGVDTNLEPEPGETAVCPVSDERKSSCPEDDVNLYLSYAAYGMFAYSADPETFKASTGWNLGWHGRVSTLHFGYEAFADEDGKKTTDIDDAITSGTFSGQTTGIAIRGNSRNLLDDPALNNPFREKKPLRGDVSLTVSIPKTTGAGSLLGKIENLEEWDGNVWRAYAGIVAIHLHTGTDLDGTVAIGDAGTFSGSATIQVGDNAYVAPAAATNENAVTSAVGLATDAGSTTHSFNNGGAFTGNFYGPRTADDLEVAGSWNTGLGDTSTDARHWSLFGSFGAKQAQQ